ncbi:nucleic-acid-binding protein from transposon x-element [Lasius niger]|uniref:Nucleic-acid-binding protein from transposon x-element n=1 Tax=Lasius niger TaxID=67767 RepID=A0A0J7N9I9_LASNI|nr:nucleic-acid-binding protein from transposon x-element [Lasius niger]KMQ89340.1 nucleic-acid-binding protein from transposon x-element [Lasius niger]
MISPTNLKDHGRKCTPRKDNVPNLGNITIYDTHFLLNCQVIFEAPKAKRQISQCANCQKYGHTKRFCFRNPRCVKCAGNHSTSKCSRKERSEQVKCVLCNGNHPANYKGCTVYKDLQRVKYPGLRQRLLPTSQTITPVPAPLPVNSVNDNNSGGTKSDFRLLPDNKDNTQLLGAFIELREMTHKEMTRIAKSISERVITRSIG